jgi:two-component system cell cycle response regulator DivK
MVKLLYVEDNVGNVAMLSERLVRRGYEVIVAGDGRQAIEKARAEAPDLILMDLDLPVIDGWEAARRLKASEETRKIPIIALSAHAMRGDRDIAIAAGCDEYEVKPVDLPSLLQKIGSLLSESQKNV